MSYNKWQYGYSNPINLTDPTGMKPVWCQSMPTKALYEGCVDLWYGIEPINPFKLGSSITGDRGCYVGPSEYRAPGYLEGIGFWGMSARFGSEVVYDFASMERTNFSYFGFGENDSASVGWGAAVYVGLVSGFRTDQFLRDQYRGKSASISAGISADIGLGVGLGGGAFMSWSDPMLRGATTYIGTSIGADLLEVFDFDVTPILWYKAKEETRKPYLLSDGHVNIISLMGDILTGDRSPILGNINYNNSALISARSLGLAIAIRSAIAYEEIRNENKYP